jgi:hypothetical protein
MPNGGSDCCGTCCFNSANEGQAGYHSHPPETETRCVIRNVVIEVPFWTYCANHPHHNRELLQLPIGPIYVDSGGFPYGRKVWIDSPDTEEIRQQLLALLHAIDETPLPEYPTSPKFDEAVITQLGVFAERRAVDDLRRIIAFNPYAAPDGENPFGRNRIFTIAQAIVALAKTVGDDALPEITYCLSLGIEEARQLPDYDFEKDRVASVHYWAVTALEHVSEEAAVRLREQAMSDPNSDVREHASPDQENDGSPKKDDVNP